MRPGWHHAGGGISRGESMEFRNLDTSGELAFTLHTVIFLYPLHSPSFGITPPVSVLDDLTQTKWFLVKSGMPQGSILGPILFLIYINDLPESCDVSSYDVNLYLYADDAEVYKTEDNKTLQAVVIKSKTGPTSGY